MLPSRFYAGARVYIIFSLIAYERNLKSVTLMLDSVRTGGQKVSLVFLIPSRWGK